jgi:beta-lactam-binding protein with PASTA domain
MKDIIEFFKSKIFLINLAIAAAVMAAIFGFTYKWLDNYTKHGESIVVPDLKGMKAKQLDSMISDLHLNYAIIDSIYFTDKPQGVIIEQDPLPGSKVKENRTVYLTINSGIPSAPG